MWAQTRETLDSDRVRSVFAQLVPRINALHQANRLHRDIKPSNVMITAAARVVLLDFGLLATADGAAPTSLQRAGPRGFMSPAQRDGMTQGPASVWYVSDATLYDISCGPL